MRLAVLADIHGNLPALEAILDDLQPFAIESLIVAGDFIGGPQPIETIQRLFRLNALMICGNSDLNLIKLRTDRAPREWHDSLQFALLRWSDRHIDQDTFNILQSLPEQRSVHMPGTAAMRVVHGSARDPYESIFPDIEPDTLEIALAQTEEPVFICGHTHIPWKVERDGRLAINPGAVCGPLNGEICAQYAILTWHDHRWQAEHRSVPYDLDLIRADFHSSGLMDEGVALARSFLRSIETGQNVAEWFLNHAYRLTEEAGYVRMSVVPDEIWERAEATFDWEATTEPGVRGHSQADSYDHQ